MASVNGRSALILFAFLVATGAVAQDRGAEATLDETNRAQVEQLRAEIANQIQHQAFDLLDELVFSWLESPPFGSATPVVLADVIAPVGYGSGLEALLENHLAELLIQNPATNVVLSHCPACNSLVVHSDATGTVMSRGIDQPLALAKVRGESGADHALFLDFEAEGTALIVRARLTKLSDTLPIVYARTMTTRTLSAALLRKPDQLVSAKTARDNYLELLEGRGPITIPVRMSLSAFSQGSDSALPFPIPLPWFQVGGEMALGSARAWTGSLMVGASFIPTVHTAAMVQARISRLLTGSSFSLTRPNIYAFIGVALVGIQGPTAVILSPAEAIPLIDFLGTVTAYPSLQSGFEIRISNRIGATFLMESMPTLQEIDNVGNWLDSLNTGIDFGIFQVNSVGMEVTFAF